MLQEPLELNRQFLRWKQSGADGFEEPLESGEDLLDWDQLLEHRCVIVLGEAGTGKTTEFRLRVKQLLADGLSAFYLPIEQITGGAFVDALDHQEETTFSAWQAGEGEATFFLDALDEAKLTRGTIRKALASWRRAIKDRDTNARLFISCRGSDFSEEPDLRELKEAFPEGAAGELRQQQESPLVVCLAPLVTRQIRSLAVHHGVKDIEAFLVALEETNAIEFARRPQDTISMALAWKEDGTIPPLRKLHERMVSRLLREKPDRQPSLSLQEKELSVERLAGIATLCGRSSFSVPDGETIGLDDQRAPLAPEEILVNLGADKLRELLALPMFDSPSYGRVRFHHRSIREYLAARWIVSLIDRGLPRRELRKVLLPEEGGNVVVAARLAPVVAWLCLWDDDTRAHAIRATPELLVAFGDPTGMSREDRIAVLRAYAFKYHGRNRLGHRFDPVALRRFAGADLASTINELLSNNTTPDDVKATLARIVAAGSIADCAMVCAKVALDDSQGLSARFWSILAVGKVGDEVSFAALRELLSHTRAAPEFNIAGALIIALLPDRMSDSELSGLLKRLPRKPSNVHTTLDSALRAHVLDSCDTTRRASILSVLIEAATKGGGQAGLSATLGWLCEPVAAIFASVLNDTMDRLRPPQIAEAVRFFRLLHDRNDVGLALDDVRSALKKHADIRKMVFWQDAEDARDKSGRLPTSYFRVARHQRLLAVGSTDLEWLAAEARTHGDFLRQLLAFDTLLRMPVEPDSEVRRQELLLAVASEDERLARHLERWELRRQGPSNPLETKYRRLSRLRERKRKETQERNRAALEKDLHRIAAGKSYQALEHLHAIADTHEAVVSTEPIRDEYGPEVEQAARDGFRAHWRNCTPGLPYEFPGHIPNCVAVSLAGVEIDAAEGFDFVGASTPMKASAVRLAAWRLNQLPDWLTDIATSDPALVSRIIQPQLTADFLTRTVAAGVLGRLLVASEPVLDSLVSDVRELLVTNVHGNVHSLVAALGVFLAAKGARLVDDLRSLAAQRCIELESEPDAFACWWVVWAESNPRTAISHLETLVSGGSPGASGEILCAVLARIARWSDSSHPVRLGLVQDIDLVERLVLVTYEFVKPAEDREHEGAYSPDARDHARRMRYELVTRLSESESPEGPQALRRIAEDPRLADHRDWILNLASEASVRVAGRAWDPSRAIEFAERFRKPPSSTDELYSATLSRLDDLADLVTSGDFRLGDLFGPHTNELHLQRWTAHQLRQTSLRHYTVHREEEVARFKKPDIRLHNPDCDGPIGIEIKIAENWRLAELVEALRSQLVAQYLADIHSRHGVLLLYSLPRGDRRLQDWQRDGLTLDDVVLTLGEVAQSIARECESVDRLQVIGINLH